MSAAFFHADQPVVVTTINRGERGPMQKTNGNRRRAMTEVWVAIIIGPSPLGHGLWLVRKPGNRGGKGGIYTVPGHEISVAKRRRTNGKA